MLALHTQQFNPFHLNNRYFTYHTRCYIQIPITSSFTSTAISKLQFSYIKIKIKKVSSSVIEKRLENQKYI